MISTLPEYQWISQAAFFAFWNTLFRETLVPWESCWCALLGKHWPEAFKTPYSQWSSTRTSWEDVPSNNNTRATSVHSSLIYSGTGQKTNEQGPHWNCCATAASWAVYHHLAVWIGRIFIAPPPTSGFFLSREAKSWNISLQASRFSPTSSAGGVNDGLMLPPLSTSADDCHPWEDPLVLTSHGRFHGGLDHANQKLKTLGILSQSWRKCCQCIRMTPEILKGYTLSEVCLESQREEEMPITSLVEVTNTSCAHAHMLGDTGATQARSGSFGHAGCNWKRITALPGLWEASSHPLPMWWHSTLCRASELFWRPGVATTIKAKLSPWTWPITYS